MTSSADDTGALGGAGFEPGQVELVAAALRANSEDVGTFFNALATKLSSALPSGQVTRETIGKGLRHRQGTGERLTVDLGELVLVAEREQSKTTFLVKRVVRGVVLRSDTVALDQWIQALAEALQKAATQSEATRQALEGLLGL